MNTRTLIVALLLAAASMNPVFAAERMVTLAIQNMTCPSCPYIIEKALGKVPGVETVAVSFQEKRATVSFEDTKASIKDLTAATMEVGFPSQVVKRQSVPE